MQSFSKKQRETSEKGLKKSKQWLCCFRKEGKGNATGRPSGDCTLKKKIAVHRGRGGTKKRREGTKSDNKSRETQGEML